MSSEVELRVMLAQSSSGLWMASGAHKANVALMKSLKDEGHQVRILCQFLPADLDNKSIKPEIVERRLLNGQVVIPSYKFTYGHIEVVGILRGSIGHPLEGDCDEERKGWLQENKF